MRKQKRLLKTTVFIIMFFLCGILISHRVQAKENNSKKILIINSYHQSLLWSKEETEGIIQTLTDDERNLTFYVEYMDWKNYNSEENLVYLYKYYKYKYKDKKIDLIMTTDDAALQFAIDFRGDIFADAPVIFCGVNKESAETLIGEEPDVTGVLEVVDPTETLKFALEINPSLKNIYLMYDNSESGLSTGNLVTNMINNFKPDINIEAWNHLTLEEVLQRTREIGQDSIILMTTYYSDGTGKIYDMDYVTREISAISRVPVFGLYDIVMNRGIIGGALLSGWQQGENAAKIAGRFLDGEDLNDIPISEPDAMRTVFDYNQIRRYHIPLASLPENSELINKPFSFYESYRNLVRGVVAAFILLLLFINLLLFYIRKIQKMKMKLSENNEELTQLYEELTASDEEMKQQYNEIIDMNEKMRRNEEKLAYLAYHDSMTGLLNKLSLYEDFKINFSGENQKAALLFIDIDNFKYVNDSMGHAFGDRLIIKVSERLTELLCDNSSLYRLSGDEFVIIWKEMNETDRVKEYASFILSDFSSSFNQINSEFHISISIGIAVYPNHADDIESLLKYADIAMYQAKKNGKKSYMVYDHVMNEILTERVSIEKYLQKAMEYHEFEVYYQPQLDLKTHSITGFEALLRWDSPELGSVSPIKFIGVAEDTHFIIPLGTWVLQEACGFLARLKEKGYEHMGISVNISIMQLLQEDFGRIVTDTLEQYKLEPEQLELEITESILMESFDQIILKLQDLRNHNIRIALDDFGKGYSSLNYLKQLPITTLKVDKSFIDYITDEMEDDIVNHIISMGKYLGMCVVAEGVELQNQLDYLARFQCDKIQGFLYSRPLPEHEIYQLLQEKHEESISSNR